MQFLAQPLGSHETDILGRSSRDQYAPAGLSAVLTAIWRAATLYAGATYRPLLHPLLHSVSRLVKNLYAIVYEDWADSVMLVVRTMRWACR